MDSPTTTETAARERTGADGTGSNGLGGAELPENIDDARALIDDIDADLVRLVERRREVSRHIQALRVAAGGVRLQLSREYVVVDRYRDALGDAGPGLATCLLEFCRGPL
jgi:chorismate mutase